ncbi:MAG: hypothetical protein ABI658_05355 [Acidimicrobiales bacterium]
MKSKDLTQSAAKHPVLWGFYAGVAVLLIGRGLFGSFVTAAIVAVPFGVLNWFLWRENGPGHRMRARRIARAEARRKR